MAAPCKHPPSLWSLQAKLTASAFRRVELSIVLTRVAIDNFRCFVKFDHRLAGCELLLGGNGTGKSSLIDALVSLRQFAVFGADLLEKIFSQRTRWLDQPHMNFEIEPLIEGGHYR